MPRAKKKIVKAPQSSDDNTEAELIELLTTVLTQHTQAIMTSLENLTAAIAANTTAINEAIGIIGQTPTGGATDAQLDELTTQVTASNVALNTALGHPPTP